MPKVPKPPAATQLGSGNDAGLLALFGKIGGFGGLVLFVFLSLFARFADLKPIFGALTAQQTYRLLMVFMILVFMLAVFGLVCWVYTNNQKKESRAVKTGLLILLALVLFGIVAWTTKDQTVDNIAKSSSQPPDLESHKWKVNIRATGFPAFQGQTEFRADETFEATGKFLVPTNALNEHIDCPGSLKGSWSYEGEDHTLLNIRTMVLSSFSDAGISKDQYQQCSTTLRPLASPTPTIVSTTCKFLNSATCKSNTFEMHFSPE